jgi:hypothetical protein
MLAGKRTLAFGVLAAIAVPTAGYSWTKSYIVDWLEPAFYYGGGESGSGIAPGTDCPNGVNKPMVWKQELARNGVRDQGRINEITGPEYPREMFKTHWPFRGPNKDNVYENPTLLPDPGMIEVTGKLAEGIDLDGNPNTGFTSLDGRLGVDNNYYRVSGCIKNFRGPPRTAFRFSINNEYMRNGAFQTVVVLSGNKDPMNDDDVTIGIYSTNDRMVKDTGAGIIADYTYRVDPNPNYQSVFKARIKDGLVETPESFFLRTHDNSVDQRYNQLNLYKARVRWQMNADGSMSGIVGGYRDFFETYIEKAWRPSYAGTNEDTGNYNMIAWYHALRRNADGLPDPKTGKNRGISTVYRFSMTPAFVVTPDAERRVEVAQVFEPAE